MTRVVVVGASSGLGRCIGVGLAKQGAHVALLARRQHRLESAAVEAGNDAVPIVCDVTDAASCQASVAAAASALGGIDGLVYASGIGTIEPLEATDGPTWARLFATNVTGAALVTSAALPHLAHAKGGAVYLSSISASLTPPWPYLGAYAASKAALDKLVEAWRVEHPDVGFTRFAVGNSAGGEGHAATEFADGADPQLLMTALTRWQALGYHNGPGIEVDALVEVVSSVLRCGNSSVIPSVTIAARASAPHPEEN